MSTAQSQLTASHNFHTHRNMQTAIRRELESVWDARTRMEKAIERGRAILGERWNDWVDATPDDWDNGQFIAAMEAIPEGIDPDTAINQVRHIKG